MTLTSSDLTVLAIDPARLSGWALVAVNRIIDFGVINLKNRDSATLMGMVMAKAAMFNVRTMVIEGPYRLHLPKEKNLKEGEEPDAERGWRTYHGMGRAFGRWEQEALRSGMHLEEVNPRTWQSRTVGTGRREQLIPLYQARAMKLARVGAIPPDAAAAVCIGDWWMVHQRIMPDWGMK